MSNIYEKHYLSLSVARSRTKGACVSLFIPVNWSDFSPSKVYVALLDVANGLLTKDGQKKIDPFVVDWSKWVSQGTTTLAIYIAGGVTTIIPLPIRMPPRVVVAESFHVKPLIAASQYNLESLLLHFHDMGVSLFKVTAGDDALIETFLPPQTKNRSQWMNELGERELMDFLEFLRPEVAALKTSATKFIGFSGTLNPVLASNEFWKHLKLPLIEMHEPQKGMVPQNAISILRLRLSREINEKHRHRVQKILSDNDGMVTDLTDLGQKILCNEVTRLCVSLEDMQFGSLDPQTGLAEIHKSQVSAKDDDLLDDLLELALQKKVQVSVVPKMFLPSGRSYIAS